MRRRRRRRRRRNNLRSASPYTFMHAPAVWGSGQTFAHGRYFKGVYMGYSCIIIYLFIYIYYARYILYIYNFIYILVFLPGLRPGVRRILQISRGLIIIAF